MNQDLCNRYIVDYDAIAEYIKRNNIRRILVQAPDGLKPLYLCIHRVLSGRAELYYSSSPTYGACDLALNEARRLRAEVILHIGHTEYPFLHIKPEIPVLYIPAYYRWTPSKKLMDDLADHLKSLNAQNIGLVASIQHTHSLEQLAEELEKRGFNPIIGSKPYRVADRGQIIGCDYTSAIAIEDFVDVFLVLAGGKFHAIGLALSMSEKKVLGLDPYTGKIWDAQGEARRILAKRYYIVTSLANKGFSSVGVVIGLKPGQYRPRIVHIIEEYAKKKSICVYKIVSEELTEDRLIAIDNALALDIYVVTSCPRLALDDLEGFYKPVLTPAEYVMLFTKDYTYRYPW